MNNKFKKILASVCIFFLLLFQNYGIFTVLAQENFETTPSAAEVTPTPSPEPASPDEGQGGPTLAPSPTQVTTTVEQTQTTSSVQQLTNYLLSLITDKPDYSPTDTALISGSGLSQNTPYSLVVSSTDDPAVTFETQVTTDVDGSFSFSYQLDGNYRPNYKVEVKNSTGTVVATTTFTDAVVNSPPSFDPIADQVIDEDSSTQNIAITNVSPGTDEPDQTVTFTASSSNAAIISDPIVSGAGATRTLTFAPVADANGSAIITVAANDGQSQDNTFSRTFTITVSAVNDSPSFDAIANQNVFYRTSSQTVAITNVSPGASNESAQSVALSATSDNTAVVPNPTVSTVSGGTATLTYTTASNTNGSATITVTANDNQSQNNTFSRTFTLTVNADTTAPGGTIVINDGASYTKNQTVTLTLSATDASGISQMRFTNGGSYSALETYATTKSWLLSSSGDGTKNVYVKFTDGAGNETATGVAATIILDTTAPVIDSHGDEMAEATSFSGTTVDYTSPATLDTIDGAGVADCAPSSGSTFELGNTTVTCTKTDSAGNSAEQTFTVTVQDTTIPVITVLGSNPVTVEINSTYSDEGATATDNYNGDISSNLNFNQSNVNTSLTGTYEVYYNVDDSSNNHAIQASRTVIVVDTIANIFTGISEILDSESIANNLNEVNTNNVTNFSGLYFEKYDENGDPLGKLTFTNVLNLTDDATITFLQNLGSKLDQGNGRIALDVRDAAEFSAKGATLVMYNMPLGITSSQLVVRDDDGIVLSSEDVVSGFTQDPDTGDVSFDAAHFTQFDIDTTSPTFGPSPSDSTGTTGETAVVRTTAIDDIAVDKAQISINGQDYVDMNFVNSLDLKKRYTYDIAVPSDSTNDINYQVKIFDVAGNFATSDTKTITVTDNDAPEAPVITTPTQTVKTNTIHIVGTAEADSTVTITNGESTVTGTATGGNYDIEVTLIQNQVNNLSVTATDAAGNVSSAVTVDVTHDNTAPTVYKWGDNTQDVTIDASDSANLTFSEPLDSTSRSAVEAVLTSGAEADNAITYAWNKSNDTLIVTGNANSITTFANDVVVSSITDLAGNSAADLLLVDSVLSSTQEAPDSKGVATTSNTTPQVVITNPTQAITVNIASGTTDPSIDYGSLISGGTGTIPQTTIDSDKADISIPASTTVTSDDTNWNGVLAAPTVTTVTLPETAGETKTLSSAIEVGFASAKLSFNKAVKLVLSGQAGKKAGYSRPGTDFTEITNICSANTQTAGDALAADGDCKIDAGADLVIWTKHFTKFAAYTQTTNSTSSSTTSSNGGGTANTSPPVCNDQAPASAPVLLSATSTGNNSVVLTWSGASDPVSYYLVAYGNQPGSLTYGNPNVGGKGTTSYTVTGLSGGSTYYFKVRAGNGCTPGAYSNELSATPGGGAVTGPAAGFTEGVLGETTDDTQTEESRNAAQQGEVKAEETESDSKLPIWPIVGGGLLLLIAGGFYLSRKSS